MNSPKENPPVGETSIAIKNLNVYLRHKDSFYQ